MRKMPVSADTEESDLPVSRCLSTPEKCPSLTRKCAAIHGLWFHLAVVAGVFIVAYVPAVVSVVAAVGAVVQRRLIGVQAQIVQCCTSAYNVLGVCWTIVQRAVTLQTAKATFEDADAPLYY